MEQNRKIKTSSTNERTHTRPESNLHQKSSLNKFFFFFVLFRAAIFSYYTITYSMIAFHFVLLRLPNQCSLMGSVSESLCGLTWHFFPLSWAIHISNTSNKQTQTLASLFIPNACSQIWVSIYFCNNNNKVQNHFPFWRPWLRDNHIGLVPALVCGPDCSPLTLVF